MMRRTATILLLAILTGAAWAQEPRMVPVTIDGEQVRLEMRVYETTAAGPAPTLVHLETAGSVGTARRGLPEAIGVAERRELGADARQPITRPPITRIESPVT